LAATYDNTLPTAKDRVRNLLGDVDVSVNSDGSPNALRQDEEYLAQVAQFGETQATIKMARSLANEFAQQPTALSVPGLDITWGQRVQAWQKLADSLSAELGVSGNTSFSQAKPQRYDACEDGSEYHRPVWWSPN
jgi:hypothetical protein